MADDIAQWLEGLGLGQYAQAFAENAVDREVLSDLTDDDLEKLGVLLGHRKKLLREIKTLKGPSISVWPADALAKADAVFAQVLFLRPVATGKRYRRVFRLSVPTMEKPAKALVTLARVGFNERLPAVQSGDYRAALNEWRTL